MESSITCLPLFSSNYFDFEEPVTIEYIIILTFYFQDVPVNEELKLQDSASEGTNEKNGAAVMQSTFVVQPINRKRRNDLPIDRAIKELKTLREQNKVEPEHEFDLFCKSLALQLKKMPLNRALICQGKLQSVMLQERLSQISEKPPRELYFSDSSTQSPYSVNQSPQSMYQ